MDKAPPWVALAFLILVAIWVIVPYILREVSPLTVCSLGKRHIGSPHRWEAAECFAEVAMDTGDYTICNRHRPASECLDLLKSKQDSPDDCEGFTEFESYRDTCYSDWAKTSNDLSLCDKILDTSLKGQCYARIAYALGDASICDRIGNVNEKMFCQAKFES